MSVHQYTAGARTRNVVNIADPGGTGVAYSLTEAHSYPTLATDGFKNFNSQKTLHVLIHNNNLKSSDTPTPSNMSVSAEKIQIWGYNSSLGGEWSELRIVDRTHGANTAQFPKVLVPDAIAYGDTYRITVPIEGIERIAVQLISSPFSGGNNTRGAGSLDIYLGVNSI